MAGHSKWANIKRKKEKVDAQKGKIFATLSREIMVAAREGGGDPDANFRLKAAIQRAREANLPNENILRAIEKGVGGGAGDGYEEVMYEGYAPAGVAVMVRVLTDNRNRTVPELRHVFSKYGGNLGESGCVSWLFEQKGVFLIGREKAGMDEDELMLMALEAGADDFESSDDGYEIVTTPDNFVRVRDALNAHGVPVESGELTYVPITSVPLEGEDADRVMRLIDRLEELDDVQEVYFNAEIK
ncbi:YebC/PmpR family DNA-binding transcriptional regulator [Desulforudis sp. 1088]|uniref:YebC/PmpR family DNA-binding transcriptional regulator n=1 Tax=unclassified Candidatus Desulforudis TaxID=2635950 RepID=UPI0034980BEA